MASLRSVYGKRFELHLGDSKVTIPTRLAAGLTCDIAFIDGSKEFEIRLADLRNMRAAGARKIVFDEVTTRACVTGEAELTSCSGSHDRSNAEWVARGYAHAVAAYHNFSREGGMRVEDCIWVPKYKNDGLCWGSLIPGARRGVD